MSALPPLALIPCKRATPASDELPGSGLDAEEAQTVGFKCGQLQEVDIKTLAGHIQAEEGLTPGLPAVQGKPQKKPADVASVAYHVCKLLDTHPVRKTSEVVIRLLHIAQLFGLDEKDYMESLKSTLSAGQKERRRVVWLTHLVVGALAFLGGTELPEAAAQHIKNARGMLERALCNAMKTGLPFGQSLQDNELPIYISSLLDFYPHFRSEARTSGVGVPGAAKGKGKDADHQDEVPKASRARRGVKEDKPAEEPEEGTMQVATTQGPPEEVPPPAAKPKAAAAKRPKRQFLRRKRESNAPRKLERMSGIREVDGRTSVVKLPTKRHCPVPDLEHIFIFPESFKAVGDKYVGCQGAPPRRTLTAAMADRALVASAMRRGGELWQLQALQDMRKACNLLPLIRRGNRVSDLPVGVVRRGNGFAANINLFRGRQAHFAPVRVSPQEAAEDRKQLEEALMSEGSQRALQVLDEIYLDASTGSHQRRGPGRRPKAQDCISGKTIAGTRGRPGKEETSIPEEEVWWRCRVPGCPALHGVISKYDPFKWQKKHKHQRNKLHMRAKASVINRDQIEEDADARPAIDVPTAVKALELEAPVESGVDPQPMELCTSDEEPEEAQDIEVDDPGLEPEEQEEHFNTTSGATEEPEEELEEHLNSQRATEPPARQEELQEQALLAEELSKPLLQQPLKRLKRAQSRKSIWHGLFDDSILDAYALSKGQT